MSGSQPLLEWDWDYLIHFAVGGAVTAAVGTGLYFLPVPLWLVAFMVPIAAGIGILREKVQHDFDPLTPHQWAEALLFPAGSIVAAVVWLAI
jgi:hypothetical protein